MTLSTCSVIGWFSPWFKCTGNSLKDGEERRYLIQNYRSNVQRIVVNVTQVRMEGLKKSQKKRKSYGGIEGL